MKTWQGRIGAAASPLFERFTSSAVQDQRLAGYDIRVSQAHVRALEQARVIDRQECIALVAALGEIEQEIARGAFTWRDELEDVHTHVESRLREKLGAAADALHAGRSRNDQIAADLRLYVKDQVHATQDALLQLQSALIELAHSYRDGIMSGYTHLQQAQPVLIAHPLLAYSAMLSRDWERFDAALRAADQSPLGSAALAGSTFDLDREFLARECGFSQVIGNSLDAVSDRDFLLEFVSAAAMCMAHLSRFAEDLIVWSSAEFGYVHLPDAFSSGSSMMPQKKNPDVPELIRGRTALVIGDVTAALTLVKGLPLGYNRDLQEDKGPLFHAADTVLAALSVLAAMVPDLEFDTERTESSISSFSLATDLADHLVRAGTPFRKAHAVVGALVEQCIWDGRDLASLTLEELKVASPSLTGAPVLSPAASVRRKRTSGSTHPDQIDVQIREARQEIDFRRGQATGPGENTGGDGV
ncbi:MAG: argininosuccinate lyase [Chloroflexota bacterium]